MGETLPLHKKITRGEDAVREVEAMLRSMACSIVDHPSEIVINAAVGHNNFVAFEIMCPEADVGPMLGRRGINADAMRHLLMVAAKARGLRVSMMVVSSEGDGAARR